MEDKTTTDASVNDGGNTINGIAVDDQGQAIPQPEETEQAEAVAQEPTDTQAEEPQEEEQPETESEPEQTDNSTVEWLQKKGIDPNSPEAITKIAEMARNAEKAMHQKAQKASELEKTMEQGIDQEAEAQGFNDQDKIDLVKIKTRLAVRDFWDNNPDAKQYERAMVEELARKPHLAGDLESLYANAKVRSFDSDEVKSQVKRETLQNLAQKQQAAVPSGNAVKGSGASSSKITPQNVDQMVSQMDVREYAARLDEINAAMAG